ncbi:hypothetical protein BBP40_011195 [Aspergillus hancockii]|nr:hypothetical protein BBP40_011195 [Aspergillus hancockii]
MATQSDSAASIGSGSGSTPHCTLKNVVRNGTILALLTSGHVSQAAAIPNTALQERSFETSSDTPTLLPRNGGGEKTDDISNEWSADRFPEIISDDRDTDNHYIEVRSPQGGVRGGRGRGRGRGTLRGREGFVGRRGVPDRRSASGERAARSPQDDIVETHDEEKHMIQDHMIQGLNMLSPESLEKYEKSSLSLPEWLAEAWLKQMCEFHTPRPVPGTEQLERFVGAGAI